jgi:hypothetical protein
VSSVDGQCILVRFCDTNPPFSCLPQDFGRWLRTHDEFDYIVDGANVAYNAQNYDDGRFTFKQVSLDSIAPPGPRTAKVVRVIHLTSLAAVLVADRDGSGQAGGAGQARAGGGAGRLRHRRQGAQQRAPVAAHRDPHPGGPCEQLLVRVHEMPMPSALHSVV